MVDAFVVRIASWAAWSPELSSRADWQAWYALNDHGVKNEAPQGAQSSGALNLSSFPAMLRRRLSPMGKTAVHALLEVLAPLPEDQRVMPAVFCSHYGEVARSSHLLACVAADESLSPTDFSLSVHNAVAGVYSIGSHNPSSITAISAGEGGLNMALLESAAMLSDGVSPRVLCVLSDEPLPAPYPTHTSQCSFPYAIALVLESAESPTTDERSALVRVSLRPGDMVSQMRASQEPESQEEMPLGFVRFLLGDDDAKWQLRSGNSHWYYEHFSRE